MESYKFIIFTLFRRLNAKEVGVCEKGSLTRWEMII